MSNHSILLLAYYLITVCVRVHMSVHECASVKDSLFSNAGLTGRQLHGLIVSIITILWVQLHSNYLGSVFSHMFTPVWWHKLKSLSLNVAF